MLQSYRDIVIFSTADWDNPFWTNKQHMASLFSKHGYRVLYVDSLGLRRPSMHGRDVKRIFRRLWKGFPIPHRVQSNIWRLSPLAIPLHSVPWVRAINSFFLRAMVKLSLKLLGMKQPLVWTYNPTIANLCASLPNSGIVYHCVDDLCAAPHIDAEIIAQGEAELGTVAQICFATFPLLYERMLPLFSKVIYEPNVSDQAFFETARMNPREPAELHSIPHPRLLFVGALSDYKVNFSLMEAVARRMPDVHWVLLGALGEGQPDSPRPPYLPNIHILGPCAYGRLPYFMAHCDVAVLPAPHNAYTASMFPMKFFEYLAAGLQVVATKLPALAEFEPLYFPAESAEEFCYAIQRILDGETRDSCSIERACRKHTWEARFSRMETVINRYCPGVEEVHGLGCATLRDEG